MEKQTKFSIAACARLVGLSRTALYKSYINNGKLSVIRDGKDISIDLSEILRLFPDIKFNPQLNKTVVSKPHMLQFTEVNIHETAILMRENQLLHDQLNLAQERELWLKSQIEDLQKQQVFLLEHTIIKKKRFFGIF